MDIDLVSSSPLFHEGQEENLFRFLHSCMNEICTGTRSTFKQFNNVEWSKEEYGNAHKFMLTLLSSPSCLYCSTEKMPEAYHELPQHVQKAILECLTMRKDQLTRALIYKSSSKNGPTMSSFDWRLKYVIGSSHMASIREPLLQLDLNLGEQNESLQLELNKDELETLISTLETISV